MYSNDLTFFTNEPERNLYDRFNKILNKNTQFFDVLVGYFRASGFHLIQVALNNVEKIRILIGINTDKKVLELYEEAQGQIKEMSSNIIGACNISVTALTLSLRISSKYLRTQTLKCVKFILNLPFFILPVQSECFSV